MRDEDVEADGYSFEPVGDVRVLGVESRPFALDVVTFACPECQIEVKCRVRGEVWCDECGTVWKVKLHDGEHVSLRGSWGL